MPRPAALLAQLARAIGHASATSELRWMARALEHPLPGIPTPASSLEEMVARRIKGEPLQYILGSQPFGPLNLAVRPPVLIPRPETEDWSIRLAESLTPSPSPSRPLNVLDLCTGTGCIPLLLCHLLPPGSVHATGVDVSEDAVRLARENASLCGCGTPSSSSSSRSTPTSDSAHADSTAVHGPHISTTTALSSNDDDVVDAKNDCSQTNRPPLTARSTHRAKTTNTNTNTFTPILADLMRPNFVREARLTPPYDVITSNPPYIPQAEYDLLPPSVKEYEDIRALLGDPHPAGTGAACPHPTASHRAPADSEFDSARHTASPHGPLTLTMPAPAEAAQAQAEGKGLTFYHRIAALVRDHGLLREGGTLALEVGQGQAAAVAAIVESTARLGRIEVWQDPWGVERVVVGRKL